MTKTGRILMGAAIGTAASVFCSLFFITTMAMLCRLGMGPGFAHCASPDMPNFVPILFWESFFVAPIIGALIAGITMKNP